MSEQFNVGDCVIVVNDREVWLGYHDLPNDTTLHIVEKHNNENHYVDGDSLLIEIEAVHRFPEDFQVVSKPKEYASAAGIVLGRDYVEKEETETWQEGIGRFVEDRVKEIIKPELGVYRPQLETRKVGKVPMHMVIDGFPRALREVAKVMGWAADVKGYKLHDWKNLPDADIEFPSAGNRHMIDNSIMKSEGTSAIDRVDHESNLVHLAHEVFNKLAELELILTGKIK